MLASEMRGAEADVIALSGTDIVDRWEDARELDTPPLIVREGLAKALKAEELPEVERIDAGHSNPTFLVLSQGDRWILRRPPRPPFAPKAHDVLREYRVLAALSDQQVRTPTPLLACDDPAVIGAPFYLMEALDGLVIKADTPPPLGTPEQRARVGDELVDSLVELHAVDIDVAKIGSRASGASYLERQIALWSGQLDQRKLVREIPALTALTQHLSSQIPVSPTVSIVHGDFKLDNMFFSPAAPARLIAILDWEMATLGDPLADLGFLTATWTEPGESPDRTAGLSSATAQPGFPTRSELASRYAELSGASLDQLAWYQGFALWKIAILLEASYQRFLAGTAEDAFFPTLEQGVPQIAEQALDAAAGSLL